MKGKRCEWRNFQFEVYSFQLMQNKRQTENGKRKTVLAPCAGITLIRFCGFDLSPPLLTESTPVTLKIN